MSIEDGGKKSNRKFPIKTVYTIAIVVALFLLAYRVHAAGEEESTTVTPSVVTSTMDTIVHRLSQVGVSMSYEKLGDVGTVDQAIDLLTAQSEYFILVFFDRESFKTTIHYVEDLSSRGGIVEALKSELRKSVQIGDGIYKVVIDDRVTHMTMSSDGERYSGVFPMASRIDSSVAAMLGIDGSAQHQIETCTYRPLSMTIFGRIGEAIKACVEVECTDSGINSDACMLTDAQSWHGFFGYVVMDAKDLPAQADVSGDTCTGCIAYEWGVGIKIEGDITINITGPGSSGLLCAKVSCATE